LGKAENESAEPVKRGKLGKLMDMMLKAAADESRGDE
jgi:hypothetical protein